MLMNKGTGLNRQLGQLPIEIVNFLTVRLFFWTMVEGNELHFCWTFRLRGDLKEDIIRSWIFCMHRVLFCLYIIVFLSCDTILLMLYWNVNIYWLGLHFLVFVAGVFLFFVILLSGAHNQQIVTSVAMWKRAFLVTVPTL